MFALTLILSPRERKSRNGFSDFDACVNAGRSKLKDCRAQTFAHSPIDILKFAQCWGSIAPCVKISRKVSGSRAVAFAGERRADFHSNLRAGSSLGRASLGAIRQRHARF